MQLNHMLKPLPAIAMSPSESPSPPFSPVDPHLALSSAESRARERERECVFVYVLEEGWFRGSVLGI